MQLPKIFPFIKPGWLSRNKIAVVTACHLIAFFLIYCFLYNSGYQFVSPDNSNLLQYDAYWYYTIKDVGYIYSPGVGNNMAFFPLFPLFWKLTHAGPLLISLINLLIFCVSFIFLLKDEKVEFGLAFMLLAFPSLIYVGLPYSESLFFFFSSFILVGYKKKKNWLLYVGLFGASLVRSVCMIFVPAILICELLTSNVDESRRDRYAKLLYKLLASVGGFLTAAVYMGLATGKWFYFIEIQKYWKRNWNIPQFPLTTISADRVLGIDGVAFILGALAVYFCFKLFLRKLRSYSLKTSGVYARVEPAVLFSMLYFAGMTILDTFFTFNSDKWTNIWSLNRHIICTPFAIIYIVYLFRDYSPRLLEALAVAVFILSGYFFTGVYQYPNLNVAGFFLIFFLLFSLYKYKVLPVNYFWLLYYCIAFMLQINFFNEFLLDMWLG